MTPTTAAPHTATAAALTVARKEHLADGVVLLTLAHPAGEPLPAWEPGAHVDLLLGPGLVRQYSLCGDPHDTSALQVAVLREESGRGGSARVHDALTVGGTVRVAGPRNHFALVPAERYLFIAGGIGITPIRPMVSEADRRGADWRLVYGGRTRASMAFAGELARAHPGRVALHPQDETGLLDLGLLTGTPPGTHVYCCGPAPLLDAVQEACAHLPPGTLHTERFTPLPGAADEDGTPSGNAFEIELAVSGITLTVPPGRSVLDVVEEAGVQVLSSCHEGTCGTCETGVLGGTPDHRDTLLTPAERAADDVMFICVSRSRSGRLVLDL